MIVEYIIVVAVFAMILAVVAPGLRIKVNDWVNQMDSQTQSSVHHTTTPSPAPTPAVTQTVHETFNSTPIIVGVSIAIGLIVAIVLVAWFVMKSKEKNGSNLLSILEKKEQEEEVFTLNELWKKQNELTKEAQNSIISIRSKIGALIPNLMEQKMEEDLHTVQRMEETELVNLIQNYLNLSDIQRKLEITKLESTLRSMEHELDHIQNKINKIKKGEFDQTVRVIETRYEEEHHV